MQFAYQMDVPEWSCANSAPAKRNRSQEDDYDAAFDGFKKMRVDITMKSQEDRVKECMQIRTQLQSLGILALPEAQEKLSKAMNDFVAMGDSKSVNLSVPGTPTKFQVVLTTNEKKKSGVTMVAG